MRVVGGWSEFQFAERRMPTLDELNRAAPDTPVFILHLYDRALLNRAALRAIGYTKELPTRRAAKSFAIQPAIQPAFSSPGRTRRFFTPRSPKAQSCRRNTRPIRAATLCAS